MWDFQAGRPSGNQEKDPKVPTGGAVLGPVVTAHQASGLLSMGRLYSGTWGGRADLLIGRWPGSKGLIPEIRQS